MTPEMLEGIAKLPPPPPLVHLQQQQQTSIPSYNAIRLACQKRRITCDMRFCRKIQASFLHQSGVSNVMIDLLQGRVGKSVLVNHYLTPSQDQKDKVLQALENLKQEIER